MDDSDLKLLKKYLSNEEELKFDLQRNHAIQCLQKGFGAASFPSKPERCVIVPVPQHLKDAIEATFYAASYFEHQLKAILFEVLCKDWNYCKKRKKFNNRMTLGVAILEWIKDSQEIVDQIYPFMPIALCISAAVQSDFLDEHCNC